MKRSYIRVTYVALSHWGKPIATAHTFDDLKAGIDEYFGEDKNQLEWIPYESKYPDEYEGYFKYKANDFNWDGEIETVTVYCVDFYPYTKYEVDDSNPDTTIYNGMG
jgi:hypothetical protein